MSEIQPEAEATLPKDSLVVVPTYNEAENLQPLVEAILTQGAFDVLVVDDNSPDDTGALAERLATEYPGRVDVLHRARKEGLGTAYRAGFVRALARGYRHVFEMDADFSHDPRALPALRAALNGADVVLGSRYIEGGATQHWPLTRRLLSQAGSKYAAIMLGLPLHDLTGGFKGFSARVLQTLDLDAIRSNGYAFQIEVTYRAYRSGFRIVEYPITFADRRLGKSKMRASIVTEALRIVLMLRFGSAPGALQQAQP